MQPTLDAKRADPATHVLAIGVADYPLLAADIAAGVSPPYGLRPVSSPIPSVRDFAAFFESGEYRNDSAPLGSVFRLESPDIDQIADGVASWFARCDAHADNVAVFYFCGHGFQRGGEIAGLANDFGRSQPPLSRLREALNLTELVDAMARCRASRQWFVFDCCRDIPEDLAQTIGNFGAPILDVLHAPPNPGRVSPVMYATGATSAAFGVKERPTRFTAALLRALRGPGADEDAGAWRVDVFSLQKAVEGLMALDNARPGVPKQVPRLAGEADALVLHQLAGAPKVPVVIACDPHSATPRAAFRVLADGGLVCARDVEPSAWQVDLEVRGYRVEAQLPEAPLPGTADVQVWPPLRRCPVKVGVP
ncbi:MAG: caspase family protein [Myxococcota bacterium]